MSKLSEKKPVLIIIDVQNGFRDEDYWGGNRNNKDAEAVCGKILKKWRDSNLTVIHVRHSSTNPKSKLYQLNNGFLFNDHVLPINDEIIVTKQVNSAFIGTNLNEILQSLGAATLVIVGLTTDHCVSTTTRMAGNLGYETYLISDATATFDRVGLNGEKYSSELIHSTALSSLHGEFATILDYEELMSII